MIENKLVYGIIPARYSSTRLPGKPLAIINGKPMIYYVYQACLKSKYLDKVIIATDSQIIKEKVEEFGGNAVLTSEKIKTGTDRCYYAIQNEPLPSFVVNIQGDEPLIKAELIDQAITTLYNDKETVVSTPVKPIKDLIDINNPNKVKVILNNKNQAIYFSRAAIPHIRDKIEFNYLQHIGLYVYRYDFLSKMIKLPQTTLEKIESLEQLRIIENNFKISCFKTNYEAIGVDTPEDLEKVRKIIK